LFPKAFPVRPLASFNQQISRGIEPSVLSHRCAFRLAFTPPTPTAEIAALIPPTDSMSLGIGSFLNSFPLDPSEIDDSWLLD